MLRTDVKCGSRGMEWCDGQMMDSTMIWTGHTFHEVRLRGASLIDMPFVKTVMKNCMSVFNTHTFISSEGFLWGALRENGASENSFTNGLNNHPQQPESQKITSGQENTVRYRGITIASVQSLLKPQISLIDHKYYLFYFILFYCVCISNSLMDPILIDYKYQWHNFGIFLSYFLLSFLLFYFCTSHSFLQFILINHKYLSFMYNFCVFFPIIFYLLFLCNFSFILYCNLFCVCPSNSGSMTK